MARFNYGVEFENKLKRCISTEKRTGMHSITLQRMKIYLLSGEKATSLRSNYPDD